MKTLIKNGTIVTASDTFQADILIDGEQIALLGRDLSDGDATVIDATGKLLLPGGIDVHTHLDMPFGGTFSSDDFFTGHQAAAFGGTTSHIDFVIQNKGHSLRQAVDEWHAKAQGKAAIDYGFHVAITDLTEDVLAEIPSLVQAGIPSLKLFMAYKGVLQVDDTTLFRTMQVAAQHGMLVMVHAENGDAIAELIKQHLAQGHTAPKYHAITRPAIAEAEATGRAIAMAGMTGATLYVVHMSCEESIEQLVLGRAKGFNVMGESCVQYMFLFEQDLDKPGREGAKLVCSPPLRQPKDAPVIWQALRDGTLQVVSTDHCPFWFDGSQPGRKPGKELGADSFDKIPNGVPGIEDRMGVMWHHGVNGGRMSANRFVEITSTNPAKIFGLYPRKGTIAIGADADILVWNPDKEYTISAANLHGAIDYSLYEGMVIRGGADQVLLRGHLLVDGGAWTGQRGAGQFLHRNAHAAIL
ncbi:MAG: dihydropyrimidinase [Caldilineaceae bacterium]|nr:dihydropyrimidinase [Caldilineaceae bacterium]